jgi:hypothetical protein
VGGLAGSTGSGIVLIGSVLDGLTGLPLAVFAGLPPVVETELEAGLVLSAALFPTLLSLIPGTGLEDSGDRGAGSARCGRGGGQAFSLSSDTSLTE